MAMKFDNPKLLSTGDLKVSGAFSSPGGEVVGTVPVRFLIIEERQEGQTTEPWMIDGVAMWTGGDTFEHIVKAADLPPAIRPGDDARGIGLSVAIKRFPHQPSDSSGHPPPPAFETFTWCVDIKIE